MIPSNLLPSWPPIRQKTLIETSVQQPSFSTAPPSTPLPIRAPLASLAHYTGLNTPTSEPPRKKTRKIYRNGYETKPKTPSYSPFKLNNPGHPRQKPFAFPGYKKLSGLKAHSPDEWSELALSAGLLEPGQRVRDFQVEAANKVIARQGDICVIAPTGSGKSHLWTLPLLAQKFGIALVIVPFTSLGFQGEKRHSKSTIKCTFLHSGSYSKKTLEDIAMGGTQHVVYTCIEMLETPAVAQVVHSASFQAQLSGIYIDEAHVLHESYTWRPAYARLQTLRTIIGTDAPMVGISATLPKLYRNSLEHFAGLRSDYHLINLGNFRPELSTIVSNMQYAATSFADLSFIVPWNSTTRSITQTIIYSDDLELLTAMFWWFHVRLGAMGLPTSLVDILHAGLSEDHQKICTEDFIAGKSKILLGSDKIGAGMDFPNVELVVQYRCRGLTLVKWEQRRGRGARRDGMSAVGVILVEKSMSLTDGPNEEGLTGSQNRFQSEDPGLLDLIHTKTCLEAVVDKWLENPHRGNQLHPCPRCSNCNSTLSLQHETPLTWVMEDPQRHKSAPRKGLSDDQKSQITAYLRDWRLKVWQDSWREWWPSYGPESLVSNTDLEEISHKAASLSTIDDIDAITHIPHLDDLGNSLLEALDEILFKVSGTRRDLPQVQDSRSQISQPPHTSFQTIRWANPETMETVNTSIEGEKRGTLGAGEFVVNF